MDSGHKLVMDDAAQEVKLTHSNGSVITFTAGGQIQITANADRRDHRQCAQRALRNGARSTG